MSEFLKLNEPTQFWDNFKQYLGDFCPATEEVDFFASQGRVVAERIEAPEDLPPFSRSTVDGFAVRAADTTGASASLPQYLDVVGKVKMGELTNIKVKEGEAVQIPTGGMLPEGADAVLMVEYTQYLDSETIEASRAVAVGENVVVRGEDIAAGNLLLDKGHRIRARDIGALAGLGIEKVEVYSRPEITIISTGDELVKPEKDVSPGEIRDINTYSIASLVKSLGAIPRVIGVVEDSYSDLKKAVTTNLDSDLILLSGGSSVGVKDMTLDLLNEIGDPGVLLHGLAIKPGKPTIQSIVQDTPVIGLPGHPASAWTISRIMVVPLIRVLQGEFTWSEAKKGDTRYRVKARLNRNISSDRGRTEYIPVRLSYDEENKLRAEPIIGKSSLITTLVEGEGLMKVDRYVEGENKGEWVDIELIDQI